MQLFRKLRKRKRLCCSGCRVKCRIAAFGKRFAVLHNFITHLQMRKIEGMVAVCQHPYSFAGIWIFHLLNRNRGLAVSHLIGARFIGKIGKDNTIQTHIRNRIGHILSERSAVAVFDISVLLVDRNRLVREIPDKAALETRVFIDIVPELLEVSVAVALCIRIFAHDERAEIGIVCHHILKPAHRRIHWADNVGNIILRVAGLILNVSCFVVFADPAVHRGMIRPGTGFISKGPQDDGRMVFITQYHTGCTLQISGCPLSGCTELSAVTVRLKICLVDKVNAELVTQIIPFHGIRIMAGTNSVEIQAFHHSNFFSHLLLRNGTSRLGAKIVAVYAADHKAFAIQGQNTVAVDFHLTEADLAALDINRLILFVLQLDNEGIKCRGLCSPECRVLYRSSNGCDKFRHQIEAALSKRSRSRLGYFVLFCIIQRHFGMILAVQRFGVVRPDRDRESSFRVIRVCEQCLCLVVQDVLHRFRYEADIAVDTGQMPVILIFQVSTVTVAHYLYSEGVRSLLHIFGDVKFRVHFAVLGIPHLFSVDPEIEAGLHTAEIDEKLSADIVCWNLKGSEIAASQIFLRYVRRIQLVGAFGNLDLKCFAVCLPFERIQHIGVNRLSISLQFPVGRHRNRIPCCVIEILFIKCFHRFR